MSRNWSRDEAQKWIDDYKAGRRAFEAADQRSMPSPLLRGPITAVEGAYLAGAIPTKGPTKGPRPFDGKLPCFRTSRFDQTYATTDADPIAAQDKAKRRRRKIDSRVYGSWSDLPPELRFHFTEKERAALHVIAEQVKRKGFCDMSVAEIADLAGAGVSTVKNALKEAKELRLIRVQSRPRKGLNHLPSIISIVSVKWRNWLQTLVANKATTIKNSTDKQQKKDCVAPSQGALEREKVATAEPITLAERAVVSGLPRSFPSGAVFGQAHLPARHLSSGVERRKGGGS